ncbi:MAG TPA: acyl-CoA dehydrogenase family protein [Sandaracinaceae bacterium LLY-WYZ-13_1]|nr:acyl-CoA dehydrogenase family protein [Sandaracinaceae bacterium LLY-WYZ-13_1]
MQPFNQPPPELGNQYDEDRALRQYLARVLPPDALRDVEPSLREMGELAGGELYRMQLEDRPNEPRLTQWDPWGNRIDEIEVSPLWQRAERLAAEKGVVATAYEQKHGALSRVHQFALVHLFGPSTDVYSCPLAMTDGAARTLLDSGNRELADRAVPHLTSRDPEAFWTSGQWMTESTGGSDVGRSETEARQDADGTWRLYGRKWFTSATTSQMALTLGRPEGNGPGGRGLALFYVETRDDDGRLRHIEVNRLKDKLGTRKVPTAELMLRGTPATPVKGLDSGVRNITPMLNITRTWNAVSSVCGMRRGLALARDYARRRVAFGAKLADKPLHLETLAGLQAEYEGAFQLAFWTVELLGKLETGEATETERRLLRLVTPIAKLTTGKQAVAVASEVLESFGGAGYVEDTGLPVLLRDAQVLPIWEGTTNVLSLDTLRALSRDQEALEALGGVLGEIVRHAEDDALTAAGGKALGAVKRAGGWLLETMGRDPLDVEAGARRFALTLGRATELALLVRQAQHALDAGDGRTRAAALRFSRSRLDFLDEVPRDQARALALDEPLD